MVAPGLGRARQERECGKSERGRAPQWGWGRTAMVTRESAQSLPSSFVNSHSHTQVVRPLCRARHSAYTVPSVVGRRKLVSFCWPLTMFPSCARASQVPSEQKPSAIAEYTPPCTKPSSCLTRSVTATCPFTKPSPVSVTSIPRAVWSVSFGKSSSAITRGRLPFALLMATFDQLPAEQRAILELVVGRGQTYDELSGMLGMPASRVRELARDALSDLAPATAARVDSDWRGQIADYVLGQQTGPEATATKGHFKRSEPARAWAYSLLDSLGHLYPDGKLPEIPEADAAAPAPAPEKAKPAPEEPTRVREPAKPPAPVSLSPAAAAVVRRRRIIGGAVGLVVIALVVLLVTGAFGGGGGKKKTGSTTTAAQSTATAYEVWLYNSPSDAKPLGAQFTDAQGNLQGRGALPKNWRHFKSVILSRERVGSNPKTPANVVVRATLNNVPAATNQNSKNGVKIISEGVLKASKGETGTGIAVVLVQGGQEQLVVQAARLQQTTRVLAPATGTTGGSSTTPSSTGTTGG